MLMRVLDSEMNIADIPNLSPTFKVPAVVRKSLSLLALPLLALSSEVVAQTSPVAGLPVVDAYYQCVASQAESLRASLHPDQVPMPDTERLIAMAQGRCGPQYDRAVDAATSAALKEVTHDNGHAPIFSPADMASDMRDAAAQGLIVGAHDYAVKRLDHASAGR